MAVPLAARSLTSGASTLSGAGTGVTIGVSGGSGALDVTGSGSVLTVSNGLTNSTGGTVSIASGATLTTSGALTNNAAATAFDIAGTLIGQQFDRSQQRRLPFLSTAVR